MQANFLLSLFVAIGLAFCDSICLSELPKKIASIVEDSSNDHAQFGVHAMHFVNNSYSDMYLFNAKKLFQPASANKVITSVATLLQFGPDYIFETNFYVNGTTLTISPRGDPTMTYTTIQQTITKVKSKFPNIQTVNLDLSHYGLHELSLTHFPPTWQWDDLATDYGAAPSYGAILDENVVTVNVKANAQVDQKLRTYIDPEQYTSDLVISVENTQTTDESFPAADEYVQVTYTIGDSTMQVAGKLRKDNTKVYSGAMSVRRPDLHFAKVLEKLIGITPTVTFTRVQGTPDFSIKSDPLSAIMKHCLIVSDNLFAEMFLRELAANTTTRSKTQTIEDIGTATIRSILQEKFNINASMYRTYDGSGLSRMNLVSPSVLVQVLRGMYSQPTYELFKSMLPIAGKTGTLQNRFKQYPGILEAKTGSMTGVSALAGYINNAKYNKPVIFSVIANQSLKRGAALANVIDEIALLLAFTDPSC
jgi:D-alanyl-D-alanine carboxypeptidase/D-alanyl-D-alanine-endopeptidase (penicillin-binding protein 4)